MKISELTFSIEQIAKDDMVIVIGVRKYMEYVDNKASDKVAGYQYEVVCPRAKYASFNIKVAEKKPSITPEEIEENGEISAIPVDFIGKFYRGNDGEYYFTAKASAMRKEE